MRSGFVSGVLLIWLLLLVNVAPAQASDSLVTVAQLDSAMAGVTTATGTDATQRDRLLDVYNETRALLVARSQFLETLEDFARARTTAMQEATSIAASLAERHVAPPGLPVSISLSELEQQVQLSEAELAASKSNLSEAQTAIYRMPERAAQIRARLTDLGSLMPDLQSGLALLPQDIKEGSEEKAEIWLAQAKNASAIAEKASLDQELLSQPMRMQLLLAKQDRARQDIKQLERHLAALEQQASALRQGEATQAQVEAEEALAGTQGKHVLVQQLADDNAELSASLSARGKALEASRKRGQIVADQAERLELALQAIERKVNILGMNAEVGHVLREQQVQLPQKRTIKNDLAEVNDEATTASVRQLELEEERRKLLDPSLYVDNLLPGLDSQTQEAIREDLTQLVTARRDLVQRALDLENLNVGALGSLEYDLHRYVKVIGSYRHFIQERLLWMPSRDPFSVFRGNGLPTHLAEIFVAQRWLDELQRLPARLFGQPLTILVMALVVLLAYRSRDFKARIIASGRDVGFVRTDNYSNTLLALALSALMSLQWPLLMWAVSRLFQPQPGETELAVALHTALARGALYFWGLEFLRIVTMPKGLVASHFRWPVQRTALTYERLVVLERTFLPAAISGFFVVSLYPREMGGALGAFAVVMSLLSMAHFFRHMPNSLQGKVTMLITDKVYTNGSTLSHFMRHVLVWVPVVTAIAVFFGYIYTAGIFSLLLARTVAVCGAVFLANELAMRWLRLTRRRMVARARVESAQTSVEEDQLSAEEEALESDPELLSDEGTKLINLLTLLGLLGALLATWAQVVPALGILDAVQLWHQTRVIDGVEIQDPVTLADLVIALGISVLGWVCLRRIPGLLEILLRQKMGVRAPSAYAATRVFQYAATGALVAGVLSSLGGSWTQIQWAVAALSVGIGFGLQEIVANFISGLIILFEQPIRVGDVVTVGNTSGRVTKIRIRATTIRDFDRRELLVPNKEFITQQLLNWSLSDQVTRSTVEVGVAYGTDLDKAMAICREAAHQHPVIVSNPEPMVTFEEFGDNSLLIRVRFFLDQTETRLITSSELMLDINRRLSEANIVVAFPQRDVHLDTSTPLEIRMMDRELGSQNPKSV